MNAPESQARLTFAWPERAKVPVVLVGCIFLSFLAHIATFFVFQVVYPQRVTIPPPPPQLSLLTPSSPENEALLRWVEAEDPALVASAHSVEPPGVLSVPYKPSFATSRVSPLGSVEAVAPVPFPAARDPLTIIRSALPQPAAPTLLPATPHSSVRFSAALQGRSLQRPPVFQWPHPSNMPLEAFSALIGVDTGGAVHFAFLQRSSGNDTVDTDALAQLQKLSFEPSSGPTVWAMATVTFGADAYSFARQTAAAVQP